MKQIIIAVLKGSIDGLAILGLMTILSGCSVTLLKKDPTADIVRAVTIAQTEAIKAITAAMTKADASACGAVR